MSGAWLGGANLSDAILWSTNLSGALLVQEPDNENGEGEYKVVTGLTQRQLDWAIADPGKPPNLNRVLDAETGEPLVWRGKPVNLDPV